MTKTIAAIFAVALAAMAIACSSEQVDEPTAAVAEATPDLDTLNEWYLSDDIASNIRIAYRNIGQQPPSVGHFAQACVLSRKAGFVWEISRDELVSRTRGDAYYTSYNVGIAWMLAGGTPDEQKDWCDKMVALYNLEPWFGNEIEWSR